jgi:cell pole-organizing protein PopZ
MASSPQHEPTMEEILASIRKIISEDSPEAAAPAVAAAPTVAAAPAQASAPEPEEADVLDLTQEVHEEPAPVVQTPPPAPMPKDDVVFEPIQETPVSTSSNDGIFSDKTRKAIDDAFSNIDVPEEKPAAKPSAAPSFAAVDGNSVEAVFERAVRDAVGPHIDQWLDGRKDDLMTAMRPLIREWMDDHFPALLEGAVRDEVARAVKARGR